MAYRVIVLFAFLTGLLLAIGFALGGIIGMIIALVFAVVINFTSYWYSSGIIVRMYHAKPTENKELLDMIKKLSNNASIPVPELYVVPTDLPNAFATGRNQKKSIVCLTEGLLLLTNDEIEAVMAHEIAHVKNHDMLISVVAATIGGAISFLAQIGYLSLFYRDRGEGSILPLILMVIFAPLAALIVRMAISRSREYIADRVGSNISGKPDDLASALVKINDIARHKPMRGSAATSHLFIINPFKEDWFTGLFSTHPPVARRVKILRKMTHKGMPDWSQPDLA
ncbi:MAG: zinc metalloprotease HtpX [Candidatus Aenigmarchaeota archaeon]|nr:zinc metalloprotease HtpX [Candidatus Aenigmarchaeota archaeon]